MNGYSEPYYPPTYVEPYYPPSSLDIDVNATPYSPSGGGGTYYEGMDTSTTPSDKSTDSTTPTTTIPPIIIITPPSPTPGNVPSSDDSSSIPGRPYELTKTERRTIIQDCQAVADLAKYDPELWRQAYVSCMQKKINEVYKVRGYDAPFSNIKSED
jgi:hypothetical protein